MLINAWTILLAVPLVACQQQSQSNSSTIFDVLQAGVRTQSLANFLSSQPAFQLIVDMLKSPGNLTVFAPSNSALHRFENTVASQLSGQPLTGSTMIYNHSVVDIIKYHMVNQPVFLAQDLNRTLVLNTLDNNQSSQYFPFGAPLIVLNTNAKQSYNETGQINTTTPAGDSISNWGSKIQRYRGSLASPKKILRSASVPVYSVTNGVTNATISQYDITASNGVIHIIDDVLLPPGNVLEVLNKVGADMIGQMITSNPDLAGEFDAISNVTIFAPTDAGVCTVCINALGSTSLPGLIMNHVVHGIYYSTNFTDNSTASLVTFDNNTIPVGTNSTGSIILNNTVTIIRPDILFSGGVIHLVDRTFEPPGNMTANITAPLPLPPSSNITDTDNS
ncbi:FAS1 domain-containing protein [Hesseltinella vesiculosa]|uniref:FAS1 domain-containing protein n=1 Tax=Hesseltinella vesiculosa TaxID=101127 RepID=A0A1X2GM56_9FUNG|nr:FAS1 domain-containing protein [Hesseltinella vesiculosa]